jgi:phage shock protein PspC (stress-responsive transcriptional regulator)
VHPWIRNKLDRQAFGVCSKIAELLNMKVSSVRLFFIYSSFLTLGSPLLAYLIMVFVFRLKDLVNSKRSSVFDL